MPEPPITPPVDSTGTHPAAPSDASVLDPAEVAALERAGRAWGTLPRDGGSDGPTFIDPDLEVTESRGTRPGERYVRVTRSSKQGFERIASGWLQATPRASLPNSEFGRLRANLRKRLLGTPLATHQSAHERLTKLKALAVLSSDALSSVAYATDQILLYLILAGSVAAYNMALPIAAAILILLAIVVLSYRQTIRAYPRGGGSYIVASDNLGPVAGLIAGCALMTSYTMTVAVSVASGAEQIISANPSLERYKLWMCAGFILVLLLGNLRGIRESGSIFMAPTYAFILAVAITVTTVAIRFATGSLHHAAPALGPPAEALGLVLILKAFSSGASALTGVEAISDGVPAFKPPEWKNARATLTWLGIILGTMFTGITLCTLLLGLVPREDNTIISQLAGAAFGNGAAYLVVIIATTAILVLAGNTAFSDFPRLLFFMARDDYAPHQFKRLGDRLAYSNGIIVLATLSALVVIAFGGSVKRMIPLYAIGVFTAFTLSQAGMCARWLRLREQGWRKGLAMNIAGVTICFTVFVINATTKFLEGAWIIIALVPILVAGALAVHRHYSEIEDHLATEIPTSPAALKPVCIVPITELNGVALQSLAMARKLSDDVIAVHVCDDEAHIARLREKWRVWGQHVPLEILESPYRSFIRPLLAYIDAIDRQQRDDTVVVVLPEMVATRWWHQLLHNQSALRLKAALLFRPGTVVINVPYHLRTVRRRGGNHEDPDAI
jgi:amino acid transporter